eukprot:25602_4
MTGPFSTTASATCVMGGISCLIGTRRMRSAEIFGLRLCNRRLGRRCCRGPGASQMIAASFWRTKTEAPIPRAKQCSAS